MIRATRPPRRSRAFIAGVLAAALALLWGMRRGDDPAQPTENSTTVRSENALPFASIRRLPDGTWGRAPFALPAAAATGGDRLVHVRGTVLDVHDHTPVADVAVVFSGADGETETTTGADGRYDLAVPTGAYRAFVRGDGVLSAAPAAPERLPGPPDLASGPADDLAPLIAVARDTSGVDLSVEHGGVVTGKVVDRTGHPVAHAMVRARGDVRLVLGTDVAETDASGAYQLELPAGAWTIDASAPDYAGLEHGAAELDLLPGTRATSLDLTMVAGCVVRGRVIAHGGPAGDGAIEARVRDDGRVVGDSEGFTPMGRIEPDGTFRLAIVTGDLELEVRAWPWKSAPSPSQAFHCTEGARYQAELRVDDAAPDLDGTLAFADGRPAAGAYLDVMSVTDGRASQQERADADGRWAVYALPAGDYVINATVPGEGSVSRPLHVPAHGVALALGGTGAIAGTVTGVPDGALSIVIGGCDGSTAPGFARPETRIVPVSGGRFRIDRVPACTLFVSTVAGSRMVGDEVHVTAGQDVPLALDLTPPRAVTVRGRVTTPAGAPARGALVRAWSGDEMTEAIADGDGRFRVETDAGAQLVAMLGDDAESATVPSDAHDGIDLDLHLEHGDAGDHDVDRVEVNDDDVGVAPPDDPQVPEPAPPTTTQGEEDLSPDSSGGRID